MNASRFGGAPVGVANESGRAHAHGRHHRRDAAGALGLLQRRQQDDETAATFNEQLQNGLTSTTIATSSEMFTSNDTTQAFDNTQEPHWMIDAPSNGSQPLGALASRNGSGDLFALAPNHQEHIQQSFSDWWQEYWSRQPFPSGYTQSSITLVACLLTTIVFLIVVGNLLVCIAIFTEKSLKPTQNWFIASLAVSDMLLGLVVMPFSLARELMGFWIFGPLWCDIHEALDVLLSTASINTLCLISLDRYWSITQAVSYLKKRTPRRAVFMIAFVWVFSAAVSLPPLFGWKKQSPVLTAPALGPPAGNRTRQQPARAHSQAGPRQPDPATTDRNSELELGDEALGEEDKLARQQEQQWRRKRRRRRRNNKDASEPGSSQSLSALVLTRPHRDRPARSELPAAVATATLSFQQQPVITYAYLSSEPQLQLDQPQANEYPTCQLSDDVGYVLYSALGSFFIPCAVMVFTYIKIGLAARKRARRAINKQARAHQAGAAGGNKRGAGGGQQRRTIAGATTGRGSKHLPAADSTLLLTPTLATGAASSDSQFQEETEADQKTLAQKRAKGAHQQRASRADVLQAALAQERNSPLVMGKLVVVERQKTTTAALQQGAAQQQQDMQQSVTFVGERPNAGESQPKRQSTPAAAASAEADGEPTCCAATLITSGSKLASLSALQCSDGCSGSASPSPQQKPDLASDQDGQRLCHLDDRKQTSESNDSSLITVMSASMNDLPQVTRFNFTSKPSEPQVAGAVPTIKHEQDSERQRAAALLKAISCASELASEAVLADEVAPDAEAQSAESPETCQDQDRDQAALAREADTRARQQQAANNSTNETCFMTIEEDSDNLEAQTGRTIMMIASTAKQSSCSLAGKSQIGMMMTMLPAATTAGALDSASTIVCNNVACLRRHARRQARQGSSYCGSSMTINDDDEEDEEEGDDEEEDDDLLGHGGASVDRDDDGCIEDDLLTDDCNGFSGSCRLDPYCPGAASSVCTHCRECAALTGRAQALSDCPHDSPLSCAYNYNSKSTLQDSPQIHVSGSHKDQLQSGKRARRFVCQHQLSSTSNQNSQERGGCNLSETEGQSLTGDDNLSLTDYYRSNEDNSSIVGHDVLDATPAREYFGPKRKSIVATAIASVGGGLNKMAAGVVASSHQASADQADGDGARARKKSSIGFHLSRFSSGGAGASAAGPPPVGGLLALAAATQQQQQQQHSGATRNLKTLRQNFFQKLNQLTAKAAAKQDNKHGKSRSPTGGKSSAHSSYGSSYEPSVDCATTSNVHSANDQYHMETTFGETDDYEQQTSAETTKQSSDQISSGGPFSPAGKLMSMAQQAAAAAATNARYNTSGRPVIDSKDAHQARAPASQRPQTLATSNCSGATNSGRRIKMMSTTDEGSSILPQTSSQISLTTDPERNVHSFDERQSKAVAPLESDRRALIGGGPNSGSDLKRRSNDKGASLALVGTNQGNGPSQKASGGGTFKQGAGASSASGNVVSKAFLASDNERHKRKLAKARERRATLILGLIMATFISCWFPFFTFYVLRAVCHVCRDYIPPRLEAFIFWMGYCNSAINPIIYTIFNRDFRKAFRKILFRCSRD